MKYLFKLCILFNFLFTCSAYSNSFLKGTGTLQDSYQITNCIDLQNMNQNLSASYILANDIDCSQSKSWNGGNGFRPVMTFTGILDGQNHVINNLYSHWPQGYAGLFGWTRNANISNVRLTNEDVMGRGPVGGLIDIMESSAIKNCDLQGAIQTNDAQDTSFSVGGLIGEAEEGATVINAHVEGTVISDGDGSVGGLIGENFGNLENVSFSGTVKGNRNNVGGLIGMNGPGSKIIDAYSIGNVISTNCVGGLIGDAQGTDINSTHSSASVQGFSEAGGLVGCYDAGSLTQSYATGNVTVDSAYVGGLVGVLYRGSISNCYATGNVTGNETNSGGMGGLVGLLNGSVATSYSVGQVSATGGESWVGGLIGAKALDGTITDSYYDKDTSHQSDVGKGSPVSDMQMKEQITFINWDFNNIWQINENVNYPTLIDSFNKQSS